ncbi:MAG: hypothetical protein IKI54_01795 [Lachnospiraceae bacterium]|nr:hypothetical protein [Lachnospiraceae bacterium]
MVNVFIIHSGKDYDYVKTEVEPYLMGQTDEDGKPAKRENNANILTLRSGKAGSWKADAKKQIRMAQVVIIVVGEDASNSGKEKTMGWEVETANRLNKQIMIVNRADYTMPDYLYQPDRFTKQKKLIAKQQTLPEIKERIDRFAEGYYEIFSEKFEKMDQTEKAQHKNEILDQYKMFQKTSEDLVARRQSVNSFYISVNSAMVALMGVILGLVEAPTKLYVVFFMCIVGIILDISWMNILEAYGTLNASKMKVIRLMEEQLPITLYDAEWRVMSDKLNNKKYVSFTDSEKRIPRIFGLVYSVILVGILVYGLIRFL